MLTPPPLFAEGETLLLTVLGAMLTALTTFGAAVLGYLTVRDKLRFDADTLTMKRSFEECQTGRKEDRARVVELQTRVEAAETKAARMEGELAAMRNRLHDDEERGEK